MTTEPTLDRFGNLIFRWISRGGVQITGHLYVDHALRVSAAWRARQTEKMLAADTLTPRVTAVDTLRLPKRTA